MLFVRLDGFAGVPGNSHGVSRYMPGRDRLTGSAGRKSRSVRFGFPGRRMRAKRQLAHFCHSKLAPALCPSPERLYRLAGATIARALAFEKREDSLGFLCCFEAKQPVVARVARKGSRILPPRRRPRFHSLKYNTSLKEGGDSRQRAALRVL